MESPWKTTFVAVLILAAIGILLLMGRAKAHDAETGWQYPFSCCSGIDCRHVESAAVRETPAGYLIVTTGEVIPYTDRKIRNSPDGEFHWCSKQGKDDTPTICLFVPPNSF